MEWPTRCHGNDRLNALLAGWKRLEKVKGQLTGFLPVAEFQGVEELEEFLLRDLESVEESHLDEDAIASLLIQFNSIPVNWIEFIACYVATLPISVLLQLRWQRCRYELILLSLLSLLLNTRI